MKKILLMGAGQLGSRHLQGLALLHEISLIDVIDPNPESRTTAQARYFEVSSQEHHVHFYSDLQDTDCMEYDLVIIATNADIRARLILKLLETKKVNHLLLEKVLFQKIDEYTQISELLKKHRIPTWVNHPRRLFSLYQNLKNRLKDASELTIHINGGAWGLACNSLHFLDLCQFLSPHPINSIDTTHLEHEAIPSKRPGFSEIFGALRANGSDTTCTIECFHASSPIIITIHCDICSCIINESQNSYWLATKDENWIPHLHQETFIRFQSQLTNEIAEAIFNTHTCNLPTYEEAMHLHLMYIRALQTHWKTYIDPTIDAVPIT